MPTATITGADTFNLASVHSFTLHDPNDETAAPAPDEVLGEEAAEAEAEAAEETGDEADEEAEPE